MVSTVTEQIKFIQNIFSLTRQVELADFDVIRVRQAELQSALNDVEKHFGDVQEQIAKINSASNIPPIKREFFHILHLSQAVVSANNVLMVADAIKYIETYTDDLWEELTKNGIYSEDFE